MRKIRNQKEGKIRSQMKIRACSTRRRSMRQTWGHPSEAGWLKDDWEGRKYKWNVEQEDEQAKEQDDNDEIMLVPYALFYCLDTKKNHETGREDSPWLKDFLYFFPKEDQDDHHHLRQYYNHPSPPSLSPKAYFMRGRETKKFPWFPSFL